jgi:hypothetical protein
MPQKVKVNVVLKKSAPTLTKPDILSGIRDRAAAQAWGEKHGYDTVYFIASKQRVYAEKLLVRVDEVAKGIEQASVSLLAMAESV